MKPMAEEQTEIKLWQEQEEALRGLADLMERLEGALPEGYRQLEPEKLQGVEAFDSGEAAEISNEVTSAIAEINAQIAQLDIKAAQCEDASVFDGQKAALEGVKADLSALLGQIGTHATVGSVLATLNNLKVSAETAINNAHTEATAAKSEYSADWSSEYTAEVYAQYEAAKLEYARELLMNPEHQEYYNYIDNTLNEINPAFAEYSPELKQEVAINVLNTAIQAPEIAKAMNYKQGLTPEASSEVKARIAKDYESVMALYDSLDPSDVRRQKLDALFEAVGGQSAFKTRQTPDVLDIVNRIEVSPTDPSVDLDISDIKGQTIDARKKVFYAMPYEDRNALRSYFKEQRLALEDGLLGLSLDPTSIDTGNANYDKAMKSFAGTQTVINDGLQYLAYGREMGINS